MSTLETKTLARVVAGAAVVAALALFSTGSRADDEKAWLFKVEPFAFEALSVDVDTNSSKFEEYRDMDSGAVLRDLRLLGESSDRNRTFDFQVWNAGRNDARYTMRYRNSGAYALTLDYNIIPHRFGNDGTQLHSNASGRNVFTISDTTQQTLQNAVETRLMAGGAIDFAFLGDQLRPFIDTATIISPRLERKRLRATFDKNKMKPVAWQIDLRKETRDGSRPYGSTFGFSNAIELPEPVRYETWIAEASGEWRTNRGGLRAGVKVSEFSNRFNTMIYDNPWRVSDSTDSSAYSAPGTRSIGGPSVGRNALAPDNEAKHVFVSGHVKLGSNGWFNGNVSRGKMKQDDALLAHTINSAINPTVVDPAIRPPFDASDPANLPATSADTEVDVLHLTANAGTKLGTWGTLKFRARYYDYDNKSSVLEFPGYVRMDAVWEAIPRITVPYAYTTEKYGVEFGFDPIEKTHVAVGYDLLSWDREFREVSSSDEDIFHVSVDSRTLDKVGLSFGWEHGDRTVDDYYVAAQRFSFSPDGTSGTRCGFVPNPGCDGVDNQYGLRKYDEAARKYDEARVSATIAASEAISVTLGATLRDEEYDDTARVPDPLDPDRDFPTLPLVTDQAFGLLSSEIAQYNAEISCTPGEWLSFFVFGSLTDRETFQRARQSGATVSTNPLDTWDLTLEEDTITWGVGLSGRIGDRWTVNLTGSQSDSDGDSFFFSPPGGSPDEAESFPEYDDNKWLVYAMSFVFHVSEHIDAGFTLAHDEFETNRFQRLGLMPYLPGALILDLADGDYEADIATLGLRITF